MKIMKIAMGAAVVALMATVSLADTVIYSETFDGDGTGIDGKITTTGGGVWAAKNANLVSKNGAIIGEAGSALLAFAPELNKTYTLSMTLNHTGTRYIGLGFTKDGINGLVDTSNRLNSLNANSMIWYGQNGGIETYGADNKNNLIANTGTYVANTDVNITIKVDTTGEGTSFKTDFLINGTSIVGGYQTISAAVDDLNYVAIGGYGSGVGTGTVDNFQLSVIPEPATLGLVAVFGGGVLFIRRRFMI